MSSISSSASSRAALGARVRPLLVALVGLTALVAHAAPAAAQPAPTYQGAPGETAVCSPCYLTPPMVQGRPMTEGEISTAQHVGGVVAAAYLGFGAGHVIEGRWLERGWIFTAGEVLTLALLFDGLSSSFVGACEVDAPDPSQYLSAPSGCSSGSRSSSAEWKIMGGLVGFLTLRAWEIVDSYTGPREHNQKVRRLRVLSGRQAVQLAPYLAPTGDGAGGMAGVAARF